jgi:hypothetical protein
MEDLQSTNSQIDNKPKDKKEVGKELGIAIIHGLYKLKCKKKKMFYQWIQKLVVPSYGTSSSKRMRFSKVATFWALKYTLTSCIATSHLNLVWNDFEKFYNMIKSTSLLESHVVLCYLNVMYFFAILV